MVRRLRTSKETNSDCPIGLTSKARLLASVSTLMDLASRVSKKLKPKPSVEPNKAPLSKPKQLMTTISNKAIKFLHGKKIGDRSANKHEEDEEEEWGDGGVWQRSILMGDKCAPLEFSGAIYYDSNGKQLNGAPPRSPRASPLPGYLERANKKI